MHLNNVRVLTNSNREYEAGFSFKTESGTYQNLFTPWNSIPQ